MTHTLVYPITARHNAAGHLEIDGCDVVDLVDVFGTALLVYEEKSIRDQCRRYMKAFAEHTQDFEIIYASKAFSAVAIAQLVLEEGLSIDVSSGGEYHVAKVAGFPPEKIFFHGNNKTRAELEYALSGGVGFVVIDSFQELALLDELAGARGERQKVLLRITPGIEAHTHSYIQTGQVDSKFGFGLDEGVAMEAIRRAMAAPNLDLIGLHAHIGSQIFELEGFRKAIEILVGLIAQANKAYRLRVPLPEHRRRPGHPLHGGRPPVVHRRLCGGQGGGRARRDGPPRPADAAGAHRAGALHRRQGGSHRLYRGHHQGDPRGPHLRERRRGHERQHPAHALRRALRRHAG